MANNGEKVENYTQMLRQEEKGAENSRWGKVIWNNHMVNKNLVMT